jgi:hypothetical protein
LELTIETFIQIAGASQIALSIGSLAIPKLLNWKGELNNVSKLISQMFWTYAGYILVINVCFGLVSLFGSEDLLAKSFLAKCVTAFIFFYWFVRILIQFFYFDTTGAPKGFIYKLGEIALVGLFVFLSVVYGYATYLNFS